MSLRMVSFCNNNEYYPRASVCPAGPQVLTMNRRAKWSIVGLSTIDPASCQVVVRDSGNRSVSSREVFRFAVSTSLSRLRDEILLRVFGGRKRFGTRLITLTRNELLGELNSQTEAVKVEVCVSLPETVMCVAFTPEQRRPVSVKYCIS